MGISDDLVRNERSSRLLATLVRGYIETGEPGTFEVKSLAVREDLRSRGIGTETARRMLIHAFAGEIIERIQCDGAREELDKLVWDRIEANPHVMGRK